MPAPAGRGAQHKAGEANILMHQGTFVDIEKRFGGLEKQIRDNLQFDPRAAAYPLRPVREQALLLKWRDHIKRDVVIALHMLLAEFEDRQNMGVFQFGDTLHALANPLDQWMVALRTRPHASGDACQCLLVQLNYPENVLFLIARTLREVDCSEP